MQVGSDEGMKSVALFFLHIIVFERFEALTISRRIKSQCDTARYVKDSHDSFEIFHVKKIASTISASALVVYLAGFCIVSPVRYNFLSLTLLHLICIS